MILVIFSSRIKKRSQITLDALTEDALKLNEPVFKHHDLVIEKEYTYTQEISLHKNEVIQVIMSLLKNALDAIKEREIKEPKLMIKTYLENNNYCLSITDNAGGIEPQILDKIFDPYFTTKSSLNGTGIGLYMSKKIIEENSKGELYAQNTEGGAKFTIAIPL